MTETVTRREKQALDERIRVAQDLAIDAFGIICAVRDDNDEIIDFEWDYANAAMERFANRGSLGGQRVFSEQGEGHSAFLRFKRVVETGEAEDREVGNGRRWFRSVTVKVDDGVAITYMEISAQKNAERFLSFLAEASRALSSSLDYETTLQTVANLLVPEIADWCAVHLVEDGRPRPVALSHQDPAKVRWARELSERPRPQGAAPQQPGPVDQVIASKEPFFIPEITQEMIHAATQDPEALALLAELQLTSFLVVPMETRDRVVGTITLVTAESRRLLTELDKDFAMHVARRAALAVDNAQLYRQAAEERARFLSMVESSNYGVHHLDRDARLVYMNPESERLLGYPFDALRGKLMHEVVHATRPDGSPYPAEDCPVTKAALTGQPVQTTDWMRCADGTFIPVDIGASPVQTDGENAGTVVVFQDISKRLEREQLREDFIAFASHELRNPITSLVGLSRWLARRAVKTPASFEEEEHEAITMLAQESERMAAIVEIFLDLSRIEGERFAVDLAPTDAVELVESEVASFKGRHPEANIQFARNTRDVSVLTDQPRLRQVITNLLDNAVKYGGTPPMVTVEVRAAGDDVVIRVADNGPGIPEADQHRIFERFFRAPRDAQRRKGLGVGLYLCREIVQRMGGEIRFTSTPDEGTTFEVSVPAAPDIP